MKDFLKLAKEGEKIMRREGVKPFKYPKSIIIKNAFKIKQSKEDIDR